MLPDSYGYQRGETRAAVVTRMQAAMSKTIDELWPKRGTDCPIVMKEQAVILASIVEKETGKASERPMIAGVYCNRLRIGMKLDADPTVIYPVTKGKPLGRRILRSELAPITATIRIDAPAFPPGRSPIRARRASRPCFTPRRPRRYISWPMAPVGMCLPRRWRSRMPTSRAGSRSAAHGGRCEEPRHRPGPHVHGIMLLFAAVIAWAMTLRMSPHGTAVASGTEHVRTVVATFVRNSAIGSLILCAMPGGCFSRNGGRAPRGATGQSEQSLRSSLRPASTS